MYLPNEFEHIYEEFLIKQKDRRRKLIKIWGILLALTIALIVLFILLFPNQFDNEETVWILPSYGGMVLTTTLIGFIVSLSYVSEKPFFEYLYQEIYKKINVNEGLYLEYTAYEKVSKEFNVQGGLITKYASIRTRRHIQGNISDYPFDIYDCTMTTSSGKSQQVHFDGIYYVIEKDLGTTLQVRTNGSPKLHGVKFDKHDEISGIKVYKESGKHIESIDQACVSFVKSLQSSMKYKHIYFGASSGHIHLALWYKHHPARKIKKLNVDMISKVSSYFMSEYQLLNEIVSLEASDSKTNY
ncbi:MAG: hypothetical protein RBT45_05380 [Acholeplasmataceae bacterium]|jgi:hypothetical protein|nr:hypothetical protein [Acholeplasmataceae bacterium]